jgi:hypothetical protein
MNRREFLKIGSLSSAVLFLHMDFLPIKNLVQPAITEFKGVLYRGTPDGDILISHDTGKTWLLHTRLGKNYSVLNFSKDGSARMRARIIFDRKSFYLTLAKGDKYWLSV